MGVMESLLSAFGGLINLFERYWWVLLIFIILLVLYMLGFFQFIGVVING